MASRTPLALLKPPFLLRPCSDERLAFGAPFPGSNFVTGSFQASAGLTNAGTSHTFSGVNFGTAGPNRSIVVVVLGFSVAPPNSCAIASVIATQAIAENNAGCFAQLYIAPVPIGTSGTVAIGGANSMSLEIAVYAIFANSSQAPASTGNSGANPGSATLTCPGGSFAIAGMASLNNPGVSSWTGLTKDLDTTLSTARVSSASAAITTAQSLLVQCSQAAGTSPAFAAAVWGP
jgi:hypothetical protein